VLALAPLVAATGEVRDMSQAPYGGPGELPGPPRRRWAGPSLLLAVVILTVQLIHPAGGWVGWLFVGMLGLGWLGICGSEVMMGAWEMVPLGSPPAGPPDPGAGGGGQAARPGPAVVEPPGGAARVRAGSLRVRLHPAAAEVPYVRRDAEEALSAALSAGRAVLLVGPSMAGKTRLAAEVVEWVCAGRPLVIPAGKAELRGLGTADPQPRGCVIWLDDLDRLIAADGITDRDLRRLAAANTVVGTLRAGLLQAYRPAGGSWGAEWDVVTVFDRVEVGRGLSAAELDRLTATVRDPAARREIRRTGLGEYVGAAARITDLLAVGPTANPLGLAYVRAAADLQRIGVAGPVPGAWLPALAGGYVQLAAEVEQAAAATALTWATGAGRPGPAPLVAAAQGAYAVHERALDQLSQGNPAVPARTWQLAIDRTGPGDLLRISFYARTAHGAHDVAERALRRAVETGSPGALSELAVVQLERGDVAEAVQTLERAITAGDIDALNTLGLLLATSGARRRAARWLRAAYAAGQPDAALNLGNLMADRGRTRTAYRYYRQALRAGDVDALSSIGVLYARRRMYRQAERLFWMAIDAGSVEGRYNLGNLMLARGDQAQAERCYRQAADLGHEQARQRLDDLLTDDTP
jgi:TPR repeat protein